jgi:hypothetical protein
MKTEIQGGLKSFVLVAGVSAITCMGKGQELSGTLKANRAAHPLTWDAKAKAAHFNATDEQILYSFWVTNLSSNPIDLRKVTCSRNITAARAPFLPLTLKPGEFKNLRLGLDVPKHLVGFEEILVVDTSAGPENLRLKATSPAPPVTAPGKSTLPPAAPGAPRVPGGIRVVNTTP